METHETAQGESVLDEIDPTVDEVIHKANVTPRQAWDVVLETLQIDLARASFETWVKDTVPISWNPKTGTLTVCARNNYGRNWLNEHIAGSAQDLLTALIEQPVSVQFVVRDE
jgi:chromosomal replication initiator protein